MEREGQLMNQIKDLCEMIGLPKEMTEKVLEFEAVCDFAPLEASMAKLFSSKTWNEGKTELKSLLGDDQKGVKILTCMLRCGLKTFAMYQEKGIAEEIFIATFKTFARFVNEHKVSYGTYGFDRDFWTVRQIAGDIFRIGELEYELFCHSGKRGIGLHIPSDASLEREKLQESYQEAKEFLKRYFPEYEDVPILCESWMLSPVLEKLLSENSKILKFQKEFAVETVDYDNNSFLEWVFKKRDYDASEFQMLPETTSLQRNMKKYILAGGRVGEGEGYLIEPAFEVRKL